MYCIYSIVSTDVLISFHIVSHYNDYLDRLSSRRERVEVYVCLVYKRTSYFPDYTVIYIPISAISIYFHVKPSYFFDLGSKKLING